MLAEFITEVSFNQPTVVVIGDSGALTAHVVGIFTQKQILVVEMSFEDAPEKLKKLISSGGEIYKIIWVNQPDKPVSQVLIERLAKILKTQLETIIQVFPLVTPIESSRTNQSEFEIWSKISNFQKSQILTINSSLINTQFIFLQDLVLEHHRQPTNAIHFCTSDTRGGRLLDPEIEFFPLLLEDCLSELTDNLFKPSLNNSVLIRGRSIFSSDLIKKVQTSYQAYNDAKLRIEMSPVDSVEIIPFSIVATEVETDLSLISTVLARLLHHPVPQNVAANIPDLPVVKPVVEPALVVEKPNPAVPSVPVVEVAPAIQQIPPVVVKIPKQVVLPTPPPDPEEQKPVREPAVATQKTIERQKTAVPEQQNLLDVTGELQRIFNSTRTENKVERIVGTAKKQAKIKKKTKRKTGLFYGGIGVITIGLGALILAAVFFTNQFLLKRQIASALQETISQKSVDSGTQFYLEKYNAALSAQLSVYGSVFDSALLVQAISLSELGKELSEVTESLAQTHQNAISYALVVLGKDTGNGSEYAQNLALNAQKAYENLSLIQARMDQIQLPISEAETEKVLADFTLQLQKLRHILTIERQLHPYLPAIFGQDGRKTYALVLQNDQELRPTGGFIEAVALLRFENGSLISTDVYSSYELDKKLVGVVAPPEEIRQFLAENQWYFRDSNWDPHFPSTAKKIAWFIEKAEGSKVDGVLAINTQSLAALIQAVGPIDIPQFNETLTDKNLAERMEFHSEVVLIENGDAEYYPKVVLNSVMNRLTNLQPEKVIGVLQSLYHQLQNHQALLSVFDDSEDIFTSLGWTGDIVTPACPGQISSENCVVDELAQVEANVGVNKANYYLKRSINHTIRLNQDTAQHTRIIKYQNTSQSNAWPKGAYKAYVRFYLPHGAHIEQVQFGGVIVPTEQLVQREEIGRPVVGVLIEVPTQSDRNLEVVYTTPLVGQEDFSYAFFDQKQPGSNNTSHVITIVPTNGQRPEVIAPQAEFTANGIIFSDITEGHAFVGSRFE